VRLTTLPCKKEFLENLQRKILEEAKCYLYACDATDDDIDYSI
jgi:hypothetical protein